ncbi:MAG: Coenzyme F420 hydrogenase/dehydrogenase, beta subunit C-terminal domain [Desulfatirhabdiaceae bacterium]
MSDMYKLVMPDAGVLAGLRQFFRSILELDAIQAILAPVQLPMKPSVMPALISDPDQIDRCDPLAPCFPLNAARLLSRLTRNPIGGTIAVFLRPCEIRAFIELVKLKQGTMDELIIIGMDCPGAFQNANYRRFIQSCTDESGITFFRQIQKKEHAFPGNIDLAEACKACGHFTPDGADIAIGWLGQENEDHFLLKAQTDKGLDILKQLNLPEASVPSMRHQAITDLSADRMAYRNDMFEATHAATSNLEKLTAWLADCVNCYNCRVACPVCYCRECVFVTDVFDHDASQVLKWSQHRGMVKLPADTVFYHLTRLAHMSTACVGCGQCSNACPNDIPVMELFRTVAEKTQNAFGYQAGRSIDEAPPLSIFRENEFGEVVGIKGE